MKGKTRGRSEAAVRKPKNYNAKQSMGRGARHKRSQRQIKQLGVIIPLTLRAKKQPSSAGWFIWASGVSKGWKRGAWQVPGTGTGAGRFFLLPSTQSNIRLKHFSLQVDVTKQLF